MSKYVLLGTTILGLANPLVTLADENISKNTGNLIKNEENKLNELSVADKVNENEPIDSWMPDKSLQADLAKSLGTDVEHIRNMSVKEISDEYIDSTYNWITISTDVKSLKGIDVLVNYLRQKTEFVDAFFAINLYLPNNYDHIIDYLDTINYYDFGKIVEDYGTDYTAAGVNHPGISVSLGDEENYEESLSQHLSLNQTLNLYHALGNKLGQTQSDIFGVDMDVNINLDESNYQNFNLSGNELGIDDLASILKDPTVYFEANKMIFGVKDTSLSYEPDVNTPDYPDGDVNQPIKYTLSNEVEYEDIAGSSAVFDGESGDGLMYSYRVSDTVSLPGLHIIPKLNFAKKGSDVKAKYVDESGKEIAKSEVLSGNVGDEYETKQKQIDGYTFKEVQGNPTGKFTDQEQTVTYVYTKNPIKAADVTAKYVDESGKEIADSDIKSGNIGDKYKTEQKDIEGYTFKEVQGNESGKFTDKAQTVTYVYTKDPVKGADVTAKYVDESGKEIAQSEVKSGNIGDKYTTEKKDIKGYTFKEVEGSITGTLSDKAQTVTYIYVKNDDSEKQTDPSEPAKPDNSGDTDNPVNNNDSNDADKTTDSNSTIKNVVNNVVEGAKTLLPKTAAEKLTLTGVLGAVVVSLVGIIILNKRK